MKFILDYCSPNYNLRNKKLNIKYIIIHYTAIIDDVSALKHLCLKKNKVSSHFFINKSGKIFNLVKANFRAWHAGVSMWEDIKDINSSSLGIEIDNSGHHLNFENYTLQQIQSLSELLITLKKEFKINDMNILGHSDIAPYRKIDPGEKFPWKELGKDKIVFLPSKISKENSKKIDIYLAKLLFKSKKTSVLYMLSKIGYDTKPAYKLKKNFTLLIKIYQMHYRNSNSDGILDNETFEVIKSHFNHLLTSH